MPGGNNVSENRNDYTSDEALRKRALEIKRQRPNFSVHQIVEEMGKEGYLVKSTGQIEDFMVNSIDNGSEQKSVVVDKIKYLGYAAWTYLFLSFLGAIYLWKPLRWAWGEVGIGVIFAMILQAVIISGAILVFCDMANNINDLKNKLVSSTVEVSNGNESEVV